MAASHTDIIVTKRLEVDLRLEERALHLKERIKRRDTLIEEED